MQCLVYGVDRTLRLQSTPDPDFPSECLIRVRLAGICGTDLQILNGYASFSGIPGHELMGIVETAPEKDRHWIGKRVVGEINVGCGTCEWCAAGVKEHCTSRTVMGIRGRAGAFAELVTLPAANLHEVPASVTDEAAVFAEPVAAACRILEQVDPKRHHRIAVVGDGRLGLLAAQVLRTTGARVIVRGRHPRKLEIAQTLGLEAVPDTAVAKPHDIVVDATGRPAGLNRCLELVKPRGTIILKTTCEGDAIWPSWSAVVNEISLIGSRCGPFAPALSLLASGEVETRPLIAAVYPLEDHVEAFDTARRELKVLLQPGNLRTVNP
jgi:alcohol dehydrogenase